MYCLKCGKQIDDDALYCPYCNSPTENANTAIIKNTPSSVNSTSYSPSKLPKVFGIISIILGGLSLLWAWIFVIIGYFLAGGGVALSLIGLIKNKRIYDSNDKTVTCEIGLILSGFGFVFSSIIVLWSFAYGVTLRGLIALL